LTSTPKRYETIGCIGILLILKINNNKIKNNNYNNKHNKIVN